MAESASLLGNFCGVPPAQLAAAARGVYRWQNVRAISYFWMDRVSGMTPAQQLEATESAFAQWSTALNGFLTFSRAPSRAAANIVLTTRGIDGTMGVLAEMQLPPGDDRQLVGWFDTAEAWNRQIMFPLVLLHELGHALGLGHIPGRQGLAVLNPTYNPNLTALQPTDIAAIRAIYPEWINHRPEPTPEPTPEPEPEPGPVQGQITINVPFDLRAGTYQATLRQIL